mgnify:CR=1 FL=1
MDIQLLKDLPGALAHDRLADHETRHLGIAAQPQVIHDAAGQGLVQFLMDHATPFSSASFELLKSTSLPSRTMVPAFLHKCRTDISSGWTFLRRSHPSGVDGAGPDGKGNAIQRLDTREFLCDIPHFQQCRLLHIAFTSYLRDSRGRPLRHVPSVSGFVPLRVEKRPEPEPLEL